VKGGRLRGIAVRDAIIVGAGPAGSTLAALLADQGHAVLLLDAAEFPREKLCGEYLSAGSVEVLRQVGVLDEVQRMAYPIHGMRVCSPNGTTFVAHYPEGQYGLAVRRTQLDHLLLEHARQKPVECLQEFRVERLILEGAKVCGVKGRKRNGDVEVFKALLTVGADGRNSIVASHLGLFRRHPSHRKIALCIHYEGIEPVGRHAEIFIARDGYGILNPLADGASNVNLVVDHKDFTQAKGRLDDYFRVSLARIPSLEYRLKAGRPVEKVRALGPLAHRAARVSWDGALLVGDAAGFYDPFTGEGVYMALKGAQLAALILQRAIETNNCSPRFLRQYDAVRAREFRGRFRLEVLIQMMLSRPALADFVTRQLNRNTQLADGFMAVLGGLAPPQAMFSTRFLRSL
jgi:geranylgeranyl reductase family protein